MNLSDWLIAIPARINSQRLPRKALADLGGKPMIVRVAERLKPLQEKGAEILVGTDHQDVIDVCLEQDIRVQMTADTHPSGTDRIFELARKNPRKFILNVQGDEPFISLKDLSKLISEFVRLSSPEMATLIVRNESWEDFANPNIVKALTSNQKAIYFSRSPIPYHRDRNSFTGFWHHQGVYAYTFETLERFCSLPSSKLENTEKLEQLRAIENDIIISTSHAEHLSIGIDTIDDLEAAREKF